MSWRVLWDTGANFSLVDQQSFPEIQIKYLSILLGNVEGFQFKTK